MFLSLFVPLGVYGASTKIATQSHNESGDLLPEASRHPIMRLP